MVRKIIKWIIDIVSGNRKIHVSRKAVVFSFFVLLSSLFWLLNTLNKDYSTNIYYPVKFINFPRDKVLTGELPRRIQLIVEAHGYSLLKYKLSTGRVPVVFNIRSINLNRINGTNRFYLLTGHYKDLIAEQISNEISVEGIIPDTIFFNFSDIVSGKIPVKPDVNISLQRQYMLNGEIQVEPDSVFVSGPAMFVDTLQSVKTAFRKFDNLNRTVEETVKLQELDYITFSTERVKVKIPVEMFTEASLQVPVTVKNVPDTLTIKTFPDKVSISYMVSLSDYERVVPSKFSAIADFKNMDQASSRGLEIVLEKKPDFIKSVKYTPRHVDYVIEK
ncbi:MAG: hypothetical protein ACOCYF_00975 [Bacteroidota bacterium]